MHLQLYCTCSCARGENFRTEEARGFRSSCFALVMLSRNMLRCALRSKLTSLKSTRLNLVRQFADDARSASAKRELAILAEAFQRYDGDASFGTAASFRVCCSSVAC